MCLTAIMWSNIKTVYYGNTKEDAAKIGFRDEFIYKYLNELVNNKNDKSILNLESLDRDETIKTFDKYLEDSKRTIY